MRASPFLVIQHRLEQQVLYLIGRHRRERGLLGRLLHVLPRAIHPEPPVARRRVTGDCTRASRSADVVPREDPHCSSHRGGDAHPILEAEQNQLNRLYMRISVPTPWVSSFMSAIPRSTGVVENNSYMLTPLYLLLDLAHIIVI